MKYILPKTVSELAAGIPSETIPAIASELRQLALEETITIGQCELLRQVANLIEQMDADRREFVSCFSKENHGWNTPKLYRLREKIITA